MKNFIILICLSLFIGGSVNAQDSFEDLDFDSFYKQHKNKDGVVSIVIPSFLVKTFLKASDDEYYALRNINKILIFTCERNNDYYNATINNYLTNKKYVDFMTVNSKGENVVFKVRKPENGKISEVVMIVENNGSFVAISLKGKMTTSDFQKFMSSVEKNNLSYYSN